MFMIILLEIKERDARLSRDIGIMPKYRIRLQGVRYQVFSFSIEELSV